MVTHMSSQQENSTEMQTVLSNFVAPNLIEQADSRLDNGYQNNYLECQYTDVKSPEERINVDGEDREEELVITDEVEEQKEESQEIAVTDERNDRNEDTKRESNTPRPQQDSFEPSWHPHVYGKPPKMPTPHTIEYILGLPNTKKSDDAKRSVSQLINVKRNLEAKKPFCYEKSIQVQTDDRKLSLSVHKNKLQEQLLQRNVRTSECEVEKVNFAFREDQPLNLSVPKSKDSGWCSTDEEKLCKGELYCTDDSTDS